MNLIVLKPSNIESCDGLMTVEIEDRETINHLTEVLKVEVGKTLRVGVVNSFQDYATVHYMGSRSIVLKLSDKFKEDPPVLEKPVIDLVVGIPRPKSLDKLLQYSSSMGVGSIYLVCSSRVERSYLESHKMTRESMEKSLILGLQQGVDTQMPDLEVYSSLGDYRRKFDKTKYPLKLIAHPESTETLGSLKVNTHVKGPILVAIGPEGGWLDHELEFYRDLGFIQFKLCDRILRTEVAVAAILSQLSLMLNDSTIRNGLPPAVR